MLFDCVHILQKIRPCEHSAHVTACPAPGVRHHGVSARRRAETKLSRHGHDRCRLTAVQTTKSARDTLLEASMQLTNDFHIQYPKKQKRERSNRPTQTR